MKTFTSKITTYICLILVASFNLKGEALIFVDSLPPAPESIAGPTFICPNAMTNVVYTTPAIAGATSYVWYVTSSATIISGQGTNTLTVSYKSTMTTAHIFVGASNAYGTSQTYGIGITKATVPATPGIVYGQNMVCGISTTYYSVTSVSTVISYNWAVPAGITLVSGQGTNSILVAIDSSFVSGHIGVSASNYCGTSASRTIAVTSLPPVPKTILGPTNACPYIASADTATYSIDDVNATSYNWTVPAHASIVSGQGTTSIEVIYDSSFISGNVTVASIGLCGSSVAKTLAIKKTIPAVPGAIAGETNVCSYIGTTTAVTYSIAPAANAVSYNWTVPASVSIVVGQGTASIQVNYDSSFFSGNITVYSIGACTTSAARKLTVAKKLPAAPASIAGPANVCAYIGTASYVTYAIAPAVNAVSYNWIVPANASIISGQGTTSIQVSYDSSFVSGNVTVSSIGTCTASAARALTVASKLPAVPGAIKGPTNVCSYIGTITAITYSVAPVVNALSYNWAVPAGASIISGQGTTSIEVNYDSSFVTGSITVSSVANCGYSSARTLAISRKVTAVPGAISGETNACAYAGTMANVTYSIAPVVNALSYNWTVPANASIVAGQGTTSIQVNYESSFVSGNISVSSVANCGNSSARTLAVSKKLPAVPRAISGETNACAYIGTMANVTYSIAPVVNALSYNWTVPANASIVSGQGTTSIQVNYSSSFVSGNISVSSVANCGNSSVRTLAISKKLPAVPDAIAGETNACAYAGTMANVTYSIAPVVNALSYNWAVPANASIVAGQGTTSIQVNYESSFVSGNISVSSVANCGYSSVRTLAISKKLPAVPDTITGETNACPYAGTMANVTYSIAPVTNALSYNWVVPANASIVAGQGTTSIQVNYSSSFVSGDISVSSVANCGYSTARTLAIIKETPVMPDTINGPTDLCGDSIATYSVTVSGAANSYSWVAPSGMSIQYGQDLSSITVAVSDTFSGGIIAVSAYNSCGVSDVREIIVNGCASRHAIHNSNINNSNEESNEHQIADENDIRFSLYPNPAKDILNIELSGSADRPILVEVYDLTGKLVLNKQHTTGGEATTTIRIGMEEQTEGLYEVRVTDVLANTVKSKRVVKQ